MKNNFIFYDADKQRLKRIKILLLKALSLVSLGAFAAAFCFFFTPQVNPDSPLTTGEENKAIIDEISTQKEDVIEVEGIGGVVELQDSDNSKHIVRRPIEGSNKVVLTFDDGPDPRYTPQILDELKKENVKAIFFVVGEQLVRYPYLAKRVVDEGHLLGVHTYSHPEEFAGLYSQVGKFIDRNNLELDLTQKIIIAETGYKTKLFRVPAWGAEDTIDINTLILITYAYDRDYKIVSSTIDSHDWLEKDSSKIVANSVNTDSSQIILMHDGGGDRSTTVNSLHDIIKTYRDRGYEFSSFEALDAQDSQALVPATYFEKAYSSISYFLIWFRYNYLNVARVIFTSGLVLILITSFLFSGMAILDALLSIARKRESIAPFVSVIVPAYNEENTIEKTVTSILASKYRKKEIIVVDNNSTDRTAARLKKFKANPKFKLIYEQIQGKYAAINTAIAHSKGKIIVVIDADTQLLSDALEKIVVPFADNKVGAVAGNIKVGNVKNLLTVFQQIEYIAGLNLDRRVYNLFSAATVIPGAFGAWRRQAVIKAGGYNNDTLTEDADLAIKIQRLGYKTAYAPGAVAYTEAPSTLKLFFRQRHRWTFGILQVLFKNRDAFFKPQYGFLGSILLPYIALVQFPTMVVAPFVDILSAATIFINLKVVMVFLIIFLLMKYMEMSLAFILSKERRIWLLAFLPLMRLSYQFLWYINLYRCIYRALKGEYEPWNKLAHSGSVHLLDKVGGASLS